MKSSVSERCPDCYAEDPWKNETLRGFLIVVCDVCGYATEGRVDDELDDEGGIATSSGTPIADMMVYSTPRQLLSPSSDHTDLVTRVSEHVRGAHRGVRSFVNRVFPVRAHLEDFIKDRFGSSVRVFDHAPRDCMVTALLDCVDSDRVLAEIVNYSPGVSTRVLRESIESGESFALF